MNLFRDYSTQVNIAIRDLADYASLASKYDRWAFRATREALCSGCIYDPGPAYDDILPGSAVGLLQLFREDTSRQAAIAKAEGRTS